MVGNQDEAGERREVVFDQESFATKICQMGFANNPRRRFEKIGQLMRVRTREAPRSDFLEGFGGQLCRGISTSLAQLIADTSPLAHSGAA